MTRAEKQKGGEHVDAQGITVELPSGQVELRELVLDFTGTLACDGELLPGVQERLEALSKRVRISVMTADTCGTAATALAKLPVTLNRIETGADKVRLVQAIGPEQVVAVGNGANDVGMLELARLGIAIIGPEGLAAPLLRVADIAVGDVRSALDLLTHPLRIKATLRP